MSKKTLEKTFNGERIYSDGTRVSKTKANNKPYVTEIKKTNSEHSAQLRISQDFPAGNAAARAIAAKMKGHPSFEDRATTATRTVYETFSKLAIQEMGIFGRNVDDWATLDALGAVDLGKIDFDYPGAEDCKIVIVETLTQRVQGDYKQDPKRAGSAEAEILKYNGSPIYRNSLLSTPGMADEAQDRDWDEDILIKHSEKPAGSTVVARNLSNAVFNPAIAEQTENAATV